MLHIRTLQQIAGCLRARVERVLCVVQLRQYLSRLVGKALLLANQFVVVGLWALDPNTPLT
jgi:hypothetical protein